MTTGANKRTALRLASVVVLMVGASFAAVPFYSWFCRVTGYAGTTSVATQAGAEVLDRTVTVSFDGNTASDMPWEFRPAQREITVRLGETGLAFFEAYNPTDEPIAGQAGYNVVPFAVGGYFDKIACFCFELQVLQPGERVEMPVSFYVDPARLDDIESRGVTEITLSYTMYRIDLPDEAASLPDQTTTRLAAAPVDGARTIDQ
jgi:cytochrome c oxidase assembly protein subunit 11